jgi:hypothetical protein
MPEWTADHWSQIPACKEFDRRNSSERRKILGEAHLGIRPAKRYNLPLFGGTTCPCTPIGVTTAACNSIADSISLTNRSLAVRSAGRTDCASCINQWALSLKALAFTPPIIDPLPVRPRPLPLLQARAIRIRRRRNPIKPMLLRVMTRSQTQKTARSRRRRLL